MCRQVKMILKTETGSPHNTSSLHRAESAPSQVSINVAMWVDAWAQDRVHREYCKHVVPSLKSLILFLLQNAIHIQKSTLKTLRKQHVNQREDDPKEEYQRHAERHGFKAGSGGSEFTFLSCGFSSSSPCWSLSNAVSMHLCLP